MGRALSGIAAGRANVAIIASLTSSSTAEAIEHALAACEVIIDFSTAVAAAALAGRAGAAGRPALVIGATGFDAAGDQAIANAAERIAIVKAGNFALGVNVLASLIEQAAARLPSAEWDIDIIDVHHRGKADAPSGTALMLGEAAARGRGADFEQVAARVSVRGQRAPGAIGFASLRAGGIIGEHQAIMASDDEIITLAHSARDRSLFARGALAAAHWVRNRAPGLYDMRDVLGFRTASGA
jgi:4-hydroxy-tetrahydrodipicolinate reductase